MGFYGCLLLLLAIVRPGLGAAPAPTTDGPSLDGLWQGPLQLPGGQLEVIFRLVHLSSGEYFATLDVPLQKAMHLAVTVTTQADSVQLNSTEANSRYCARLTPDGTQLLGVWLQPGFRVPLTLTHQLPPAVVARPRLTPPYREEEVTFNNQLASLKLAGMLTVPAGAGPFPAVVLLGDTDAQNREGTSGTFLPLVPLADYLTRRGVAVLRLAGRGTDAAGSAQLTTAEQVTDVRAALNFLRTRPEINLTQLGLIGHGEGGNIALLTATQPLPPAFVIGLAPYGLPGAETALQQQETMLHNLGLAPEQVTAGVQQQQAMLAIVRQVPDNAQAQAILANMLKQNNPVLADAAAQASAADMVSPRFRDFVTFDPLESLPQVACPVLLLAGTADLSLPIDSHLRALAKGLRNNKAVTIRKLPGVNHLFQPDPQQWPIVSGEARPTFSPLAEETIRSWIVTQTSKQ